MKKLFFVFGWFFMLALMAATSLMITILASWSIFSGFIVFFTLLFLTLVICLFIKLSPDIVKMLRKRFILKRRHSNRFERLLWEHWWRGGRLQSWLRFLTQWKRRATIPPWFLVTGPKGSGKMDLLNGGQLSLLPEKRSVYSTERFITCHWWFFSQSMYMLVSGRYIDGSPLFRRAWLNLSRWIGKVRRPAGVIVCLPMEMLLTSENNELITAAHTMRARLETLQLRIGYRLPVWLMVTGAERMPGFGQFCSQLSEESCSGSLGSFIDPTMDGDVAGALKQSLLKVTKALQIARLKTCYLRRTQPEYLQFGLPERMAELEPALCCYARAMFESNRYQQHALLRGLFFSARVTSEGQGQPENFFSKRLLEEHLPAMAERYRPVRLCGRGFMIKGFLCIATIFLILCMLLNSLLITYRGVVQYNNIYYQQSHEQAYMRFKHVELWRKKANWASLLFYPVRNILEKRVSEAYLSQCDTNLFRPSGTFINQLRRQFLIAGESQKRELILNWARFINTEQAIANGASLPDLQALPVWSPDLFIGKKSRIPSEQSVALRLAAWRLGKIDQNLALWRSVLKTMLEQSNDWRWLLSDDDTAKIATLTLADFWPLSDEDANKTEAFISGKYTETGHQVLKGIINELDQALREPAWFAPQRKNFWYIYHQHQQGAWLKFAQAMPDGENLVQGKKKWQSMILSISHYDSPYMKFLRRIARDLSNISEENQQEWLHTQLKLWQLQKYIQKSDFMKRVSLGNLSLREYLLSPFGISNQNSLKLNENIVSRYLGWRHTLEKNVQRVLTSDQEAEQMLRVALGNKNATNNDNQLSTMFNMFSLWRSATQDENHSPTGLLWRLWQGEGHLILRYAFLNSASQLQSSWETNVLGPVEKLHDDNLMDERELNERLYEYVYGFVRNEADFALKIQGHGIERRKIEDIRFPFYDDFMIYLNGIVKPDAILPSTAQTRRRLMEKQSILKSEQELIDGEPQKDLDIWGDVTLTSLPATANPGARQLPTGSTFTLQCHDNLQQFSNINFKDSMSIKWKPQSCGTVQIDVNFPSFTLSKRFEGADGLLQFMSAFSNNELTLSASLFPEHKDILNAMNISKVIVRYEIDGQEQAAALYKQWQSREQQQIRFQTQSDEIHTQLMNLSEKNITRGSFSNLPYNITAGWNN